MTPERSDDRVLQLERECAELRRQLDIVHASRSWRLTAPLRRVGVLARRRRFGSRATEPIVESGDREDAAFPPPALRSRVAGTPDLDWFMESAKMALQDLEAALRAEGRLLAGFGRIYDFGCGCGRLTLPLAALVESGQLTATDSDGAATEWLRARLPDVRVESSPSLPPLPYLDGEFDLIIGWSVFTHLPEDYQDAWLAELARVLSADGRLLLTVNGPTSFDVVGAAVDDPVRNALAAAGFIYYDKNYGADSPFGSYYQDAFHHPEYVRRHWSRWFEVAAIRAGGARPAQDMVVLRPHAAPAPAGHASRR